MPIPNFVVFHIRGVGWGGAGVKRVGHLKFDTDPNERCHPNSSESRISQMDGRQPQRGCVNLLFDKILAKPCMKIKEIVPSWAGRGHN